MKLNLEEIRQNDNSVECGIACLNMILNYHGKDVDYNFILDAFKGDFKEIGLSVPQLGKFIIKNFDMDATIVSLNPLLFSVDETNASKNSLINRIEKRINTLSNENDRLIAKEFLDFLNIGGEILAQIPNIHHIENEINLKNPLIASLNSNFLNGKLLFNFHFNVITGYDENNFYVNDPLNDFSGGKKCFNKLNYMYAIHSTSFGDLDNSSLLFIRPKNNFVQN